MKNQFNGSLPSYYYIDIPDQSATVKREMGLSLAFIIWAEHALEEVYSLEVTGGGPHRQKIFLVVMRLPGIPVPPPSPPTREASCQ